jgi:hypothetical protein
MPIKLRDFVTQCDVDADQANSMIEALYMKPPSVDSANSSPHYSLRLKEISSDAASKKLVGQLNVIVERETSIFTTQARFDIAKYLQVFGSSPGTEAIQIRSTAMLRAARFSIFKTGNCSVRACYAAFELYKLLAGRADIGIKSSPKRDQYTLMIRKKDETSWYIYDAITNPELLFSIEEYQSDILPLYPEVQCPARQFSLTISSKVFNKYQSVAPKVQAFFNECSQEVSFEGLMSDYDFLCSSGLTVPGEQPESLFAPGMHTSAAEVSQEKIDLVRQAIVLFKNEIKVACRVEILTNS